MSYDPAVYQNQAWFDSLSYTDDHNRRALFAVLALLGNPKTFMDIGCGTGALVKLMIRLEESWDPEQLSIGLELWLPEYSTLDRRLFAVDLRDPYDHGRQFELVTCWEVGEHLPKESANTLCDTIARHVQPGGYLVFTAAPPGQGGDYHVNEQPQSYWTKKLTAHGLRYDKDLTGRVSSAWQWATGPCFWLPQNVMVFKKGEDGRAGS
jgi:2-polyprenyl-3-methyl-5-hydroxy-6-metoxy-1,4-benzoquinol methylase